MRNWPRRWRSSGASWSWAGPREPVRSSKSASRWRGRSSRRRALPTCPADLRAQVADELNVREIEPLDVSDGSLVRHTVKANFRALGKRFGSGTQPVAAAITAADSAALAARLRTDGEVQLTVDGEVVSIGPDDVVVTQTPIAGWTVASDGGDTVALEVTITPELRREGLAREFIRQVQDARKSDGLDVSDRISLRWSTADPDVSAALTEHRVLISGEVLAVDFGRTDLDAADSEPDNAEVFRHGSPDLGLTFWLQRRR